MGENLPVVLVELYMDDDGDLALRTRPSNEAAFALIVRELRRIEKEGDESVRIGSACETYRVECDIEGNLSVSGVLLPLQAGNSICEVAKRQSSALKDGLNHLLENYPYVNMAKQLVREHGQTLFLGSGKVHVRVSPTEEDDPLATGGFPLGYEVEFENGIPIVKLEGLQEYGNIGGWFNPQLEQRMHEAVLSAMATTSAAIQV